MMRKDGFKPDAVLDAVIYCNVIGAYADARRSSDAFSLFNEYVIGTPYRMSPEIIELRNLTPACDVLSLGCKTMELIT